MSVRPYVIHKCNVYVIHMQLQMCTQMPTWIYVYDYMIMSACTLQKPGPHSS